MNYTYDMVTGYCLVAATAPTTVGGYYPSFAEAAAVAKDGDHIHMICGRASAPIHHPECEHTGCKGLIAPFPEGTCSHCNN